MDLMFKKRNQFNQLPETGYTYNNPSGVGTRPKKLLRLFILVALILVAVLLGSLINQRLANNPKSVAQRFLVTTSKGELDKSYQLTSKSFGLSLSKDEWSKKVDVYQLLFTKGVKHASGEVKTDEDGQKYNKEIFKVGGDDVSYTVEVDVSNDSGKWQVNRMNVEEAR